MVVGRHHRPSCADPWGLLLRVACPLLNAEVGAQEHPQRRRSVSPLRRLDPKATEVRQGARRPVARRRGQQAAAIIRPAARQADTNSAQARTRHPSLPQPDTGSDRSCISRRVRGGHPQFHPHAGSQKESPYGLHTISIVIPPAWRRLLLGDACVSELPCQEWPVSPRGCDWGVNRHQKWRTRVPGDPSRAARLIPRIPGAVRLWPKWARASWDTLLGLHDTGGTNEQPSQLRSHPGRTRCDPAR